MCFLHELTILLCYSVLGFSFVVVQGLLKSQFGFSEVGVLCSLITKMHSPTVDCLKQVDGVTDEV